MGLRTVGHTGFPKRYHDNVVRVAGKAEGRRHSAR
jgi:hypothetical protein